MLHAAPVFYWKVECRQNGVYSKGFACVLACERRDLGWLGLRCPPRDRHMLRQTGLELFMAGDGGSAFFNFESSKERDEVKNIRH